MTRALAPALAVSMLAALAGCGSSGDRTTDSAASPGASSAPVSSPAASLPARWWIWSEAADPAHNPIDDRTGAHCVAGQPEDVWFLAGTHGGSATRTCAVPHGRSIYFPVLNQICSVRPGGDSAATLKDCGGFAGSTAEATLDGKALTVVEATSGGVFRITGGPGSTTLDTGVFDATAAGLWVGPLVVPDGKHTLRFGGRAGSFSLNVTYRLTVG
jgi:hypothetical protein